MRELFRDKEIMINQLPFYIVSRQRTNPISALVNPFEKVERYNSLSHRSSLRPHHHGPGRPLCPININIYHSHWSSAAANHLGNEVSSLVRWIKIIQYRRHQTVQTMNSCPQGVSSIYLLHGSPLRKIEFPKGQWCLARVEKTSGGTRLVRGGWEGHFNLHFSDQFSLN